AGGPDQYTYAGNTPVNLIDSAGLAPRAPRVLFGGGNNSGLALDDTIMTAAELQVRLAADEPVILANRIAADAAREARILESMGLKATSWPSLNSNILKNRIGPGGVSAAEINAGRAAARIARLAGLFAEDLAFLQGRTYSVAEIYMLQHGHLPQCVNLGPKLN